MKIYIYGLILLALDFCSHSKADQHYLLPLKIMISTYLISFFHTLDGARLRPPDPDAEGGGVRARNQ